MVSDVVIENIEEMRRREGIDDVELRAAVRRLKVGDLVNLTFLLGEKASTGETLPVRITSIGRDTFRGKLAEAPTTTGLAGIRVGSPVEFTATHIHSLPTGHAGDDSAD